MNAGDKYKLLLKNKVPYIKSSKLLKQGKKKSMFYIFLKKIILQKDSVSNSRFCSWAIAFTN